MHAPNCKCMVCELQHKVHAVVHEVLDKPVVHKKRKPGKYKDAEARKAYRREWMRKQRSAS